MDKGELRLELQRRLLNMSDRERRELSRKACENLVRTPEFKKARVVMMCLSLPQEVDTADAILAAWQQGKRVAVPKISWEQRHMIPVEINSLETGFRTDRGGLRNPIKGVPVPFSDIDIVVAPGLGFDKHGNRLGRGGSYFDRFFANEQVRAKRCGFAFSVQVLDEIPVTETDEPVEILVTEDEVIYCNNKQGG